MQEDLKTRTNEKPLPNTYPGQKRKKMKERDLNV